MGLWHTDSDGGRHEYYCATFGDDPEIETEGESRLDLVSGHSVLHRVRTPTTALWLNKWSDGQPPSGGYHRYTLRVGNDERADVAASDVVLTDDLPGSMTFVSANPAESDVAGNKITWNLDSDRPGDGA